MRPAQRGMLAAVAGACLLAALFGTAILANNYILQVGTTLGMSVALCLSWNLVGGYMGYPSFATAAFFGLGAYVAAIAQSADMPAVAAWLLAAMAGGVVALVLGVILLGLRGHYFAIGTIALVEVWREVATNWDSVTGGAVGINLPLFLGTPRQAALLYYGSMWSLAVLGLVLTAVIARSPFGFGLRCIRQNEPATRMVGIDVFKFKVVAFALSGILASAAGAIYAGVVSFIEPNDVFNVLTSVEVPVMVMLGGAGTIVGPLVGAAIFTGLSEFVWVHFINLHEAILGALVVLVIMCVPNGVSGAIRRLAVRRGKPGRTASSAFPTPRAVRS